MAMLYVGTVQQKYGAGYIGNLNILLVTLKK